MEINYNLTLSEIREDSNYINILNEIIKYQMKSYGKCTINDIIVKVHNICPELKQYCNDNKYKIKISSLKDKGIIGKIIEFYLFGNLPNNSSDLDTPYGDIKTTHFKNCKLNKKAYNAKERLTLTNYGNANKEYNIKSIIDKKSILETKYYKKIRTGIILVLEYDNLLYNTIESIYNKKILAIILYNLDNIFENYSDISNIFQEDFTKIKKCIIEKNITQKGQKYLHIHKHGNKKSSSRAFGFTNKFLTKLVSIYINIPLVKISRGYYITF